MIKNNLLLLLFFAWATVVYASPTEKDFVWFDETHPVTYSIQGKTDPVVEIAAQMFCEDMKLVTGSLPQRSDMRKACIRLVQLDKASAALRRQLRSLAIPVDSLSTLTDGFHLSVRDGHIYIVGRNGRGTAYGLLELSRMAGVSPWVWWGDIVPEKRSRLTLHPSFRTTQGASVQWRGIFLNDEDWSLRPWSCTTFEPAEPGVIGVQTYKKVFQLLLRLRANTIWPAMHEGTRAFFRIEGAKAMADSCGIAVGTSHCEPLLRNNVDEWKVGQRGAFNYITNRDAVQHYWIERLKEVKSSAGGNMFTIGMRGIHDGSMEGVKTMDEKFEALQRVIDDQQQLISKYVGNPSEQTQVFVPYKEVLEIYERGLKVPDSATLMWCDDNYGYMTRLSDETEQKRSGGAGVYYHLSYWGRPHDYLWLTTTQPGLIYNEMRAAYDHQVRKIWIANVHDPKVAGYDLELFLDMAWDIQRVSASTLKDHYHHWLCRQFGEQAGDRLLPVMYEFYRLCGQRKPEFMGWSQTELSKETFDRGLSPVRNTAFSTTAFGGELDGYLKRFLQLSQRVEDIRHLIRPELHDAYFAALSYPVQAAAAHAEKILEAQRARQLANGSTRNKNHVDSAVAVAVARSQRAYQTVRRLTDYYNKVMSGGKWCHSMDMKPRDLPVYGAPVLPLMLTDKEVNSILSETKENSILSDCKNPVQQSQWPLVSDGSIVRNACQWQEASGGVQAVQMLGHSMNAVSLPKGASVVYHFETHKEADAVLRTALIPTQPNDNGDLRFSVSVDGAEPVVYSLKEKFRSEGWKQNVLRGQALRETSLRGLKEGKHTLTIRALDHHVVLDQWMLDFTPSRRFYLLPASDSK